MPLSYFCRAGAVHRGDAGDVVAGVFSRGTVVSRHGLNRFELKRPDPGMLR